MALIPQSEIQQIAESLRQAYTHAYGLKPEDVKQVMAVCVSYYLKNSVETQRLNALQVLVNLFAGMRSDNIINELHEYEQKINFELTDRLCEILNDIVSPKFRLDIACEPSELLENINKASKQIENRIQKVAKRVRGGNSSLVAMIDRMDAMFTTNDGAMEKAAQETFDRLLNALDPESVKKTVSKKALSTSVSYKASLYDAICEKYKQLTIYHEKGRLVRDYRMAFRQHLKKKLTEIKSS